jgi:hypothetical protein
MNSLPASDTRLTKRACRLATFGFNAVFFASLAGLSAHVVKGLDWLDLATAFVSSPSAGTDAPIPIGWAQQNTGLKVVCFNVANTSPARPDSADWPRITGVGLELPGSPSGFALMAPLDGDWDLVEGARASLPDHGTVILDLAILARVNPTGRTPGQTDSPRGIRPGQQGVRGSGTRFCVSGPFPDRLPDLSTADPADTVTTTIEGLLNGVVVAFHGVTGNNHGSDAGVWFPPPGTAPRAIPLYP